MAKRTGWAGWGKSWRRIAARITARIYSTTEGSIGVGASSVQQEFDPRLSLSTLALFPWVRVCVHARSGDLAGLPLVAVTDESRRARRRGGARGRNKKLSIVDDPAVALLEQPNATTGGVLFRKQMCAFLDTTGNAYIWAPADAQGAALYLIHPAAIEPIPGFMGTVTGYRLHDGGEERVVSVNEIYHVRDIAWQDSTQAVVGEGPIRCLAADLQLEQSAKEQAKEQAKRGRPDLVLISKEPLGDVAAQKVADKYDQTMRKGSGVLVLGEDFDVEKLNYTPKEMEFKNRADAVRDTTLAVFEVPPARAGLPGSNYGTQKQQMRTYWEALQRRARLIDEVLSRLAAPGVSLMHDFSGVESLQAAHTERQMRVATWVGMGASPLEAAEYEGFYDAPVPDRPLLEDGGFNSPRRPRREPDEPEKTAVRIQYEEPDDAIERSTVAAALGTYLTGSAARWEVAARSMVDTGDPDAQGAQLALYEQTERATAERQLSWAGLPPEVARWWAGEIVGVSAEGVRTLVALAQGDEVHRLGLPASGLFGAQRAQRLATKICGALDRAEEV